jgi:hypothetical protein
MISMAPGGVQVGIINAQTNQKGFTLPRVEMAKIPPGQWFKLEIIAEGNHHVVLVNGKKTTDAVDANIPDAGVIYLSLLGAETIEFRKIEIKELNAGAVAPVFVPAPDFIQLFNGKDLTGWKTHPQLMGNWRVENGVLIGVGGNQGPGRLDSDRAYARDFHLRVEARINEKGSGSVLFRAQDGAFVGYEAPLNASAPFIHKTGSLYGHVPGRRNDLAVAKQSLTAPGEWFMLEVIAEASHLTIKVNGIITVNTLDSSALRAGHLALVSNPNSTVEFRRIEIKAAQ